MPTTDDYEIGSDSPDVHRGMARTGELTAAVERAGTWMFHAGLRPPSSATVVRAVGGDVSMTDGPSAETKERMGGLWTIEAADLGAALDGAAKAKRSVRDELSARPRLQHRRRDTAPPTDSNPTRRFT